MTDPMSVKIARIISEAIRRLDRDDRGERIAYCRATGEHGVRAHVEGELVRFTWGGRDLALVEHALLVDDAADLPAPEFIPKVPDTPEHIDWGAGPSV